MEIASFVYLRRIYEHIVETEYKKLSQSSEKPEAKFDEKMKAVDKTINLISDELDANKSQIYSILSKGIHEYEEDESYKIYPMMMDIITLTLDNTCMKKKEKVN